MGYSPEVIEARRKTEDRLNIVLLRKRVLRRIAGITAYRSVEGPHESYARTNGRPTESFARNSTSTTVLGEHSEQEN